MARNNKYSGSDNEGFLCNRNLFFLSVLGAIIVGGWLLYQQVRNINGLTTRETIIERRKERSKTAKLPKWQKGVQYPNLEKPKKTQKAGPRGKVDWEKIKRETEAAVKSGKMTRKQADAKYQAIQKRIAGKDERKR